MTAYFYYWSPVTHAVTTAFAKDMADGAGSPRKVGTARNREEAQAKAAAHFQKAHAAAKAAGRAEPKEVNMI